MIGLFHNSVLLTLSSLSSVSFPITLTWMFIPGIGSGKQSMRTCQGFCPVEKNNTFLWLIDLGYGHVRTNKWGIAIWAIWAMPRSPFFAHFDILRMLWSQLGCTWMPCASVKNPGVAEWCPNGLGDLWNTSPKQPYLLEMNISNSWVRWNITGDWPTPLVYAFPLGILVI